MKIKVLAGSYIFIIAVLIFLANNRSTQYLFRFVRELPFGDKIGHFGLMGGLSFVVNLAVGGRQLKIWRANFPLGTLIVLTVVTIEEFSQIFVKGRTFDLTDLVFDFAGILLFGQAACWLIAKKASQI